MRWIVILLLFYPGIALACTGPGDAHLAQHLAAVNAVRAQAGLSALAHAPALSAQAQTHACDMAQRGYFSHTTPDGQDMFARLRAAQLPGACRGAENIAKGQRDIAAAMRSWMGSDGHRRNLLEPKLTHAGFALAPGNIWVQLFAGRC
jgi:uncharacterized protein YkwD